MLLLKTSHVLVLLLLPVALSAYRILGIMPTSARSHFIVGSSLLKELARRGHDVTVISPYPLQKPLANYHDIATPSVFQAMEVLRGDLWNHLHRSVIENVMRLHDLGLRLVDAVLSEPDVQALMSSNATFDVVICEVFVSEALYGLSEHFKAPLIGLGTFGAHLWNTDMVGSPSPPSYIPNALLHFTDRMSFGQRVFNLAMTMFERLFNDFYYLPKQEALYKRYFPHAKRSMYEVRKDTALVLLNSHVSLSYPRPYMPNQIEVGGMHINRQQRVLPADIQRFLDEANDGAIYFSMGSNLKSANLPLEKRAAILKTFASLRQRVLWKFEETNLPGKPKNVFISDWFPQDDILAHPNVRLFITHGGLLSTTEAMYHGKPYVGMPVFGDQFMNMARAEANGCGISVPFEQLDKNMFTAAIRHVLENATYTRNARVLSARYRDQQNPLDLAVHWVELVARHKGATYMHCAGLDLNFWQYHNVDILLVACLVIYGLYKGMHLLADAICTKQKKVKVT